MIFGTLTLPGTRWYVLTVWDPQVVRDQKNFGNHGNRNQIGYGYNFKKQDGIG